MDVSKYRTDRAKRKLVSRPVRNEIHLASEGPALRNCSAGLPGADSGVGGDATSLKALPSMNPKFKH